MGRLLAYLAPPSDAPGTDQGLKVALLCRQVPCHGFWRAASDICRTCRVLSRLLPRYCRSMVPPIPERRTGKGGLKAVSAFLRQRDTQAAAASGIVMMLLGVLLFAVNDTLGKWLVGTYAVGQLMLVRSAAGLLAMTPSIRRAGFGVFRQAPRPGLQLLRVLFSTLESSLFFWALTELPLAEVMTYYMAGPIYVTALSPLPARRAGGLAPMDGGRSGLWRRSAGPASFARLGLLRGRLRPGRKLLLRSLPCHDPQAGGHARYGADDRPAPGRTSVWRRAGAGIWLDAA